jgi:phosphoribosyl-AMP cyclohydrolase
MSTELEEGSALTLDFGKLKKVAKTPEDVLVAVAQHAETGEVLIVGYVNELALKTAIAEGLCTFWSTSRNELWIKGKTSGDTLKLVDIYVNCEQNSLLYKVLPQGQGACHTKGPDGRARPGCYYRRLNQQTGQLEML